MKQKTIILVLIFFACTIRHSFAFAQSATNPGSLKAMRQQNQQDRVTNLKARADNEINRRVTSLNKLITRIGNMKRLSSENKSTLSSQIQAQITSLTTLKAKIDADTDLPTLQTDVKSVIALYRIYALFLPKAQILAASDILLQGNDKLSSLSAKLQTRIQQAQTAGKDVTTLQTWYSDMQSKIQDAKTQGQNSMNMVLPLTPNAATDYKPALLSARSMLQAARQDLKTALQDARSIIQSLRQMKVSMASSSASR